MEQPKLKQPRSDIILFWHLYNMIQCVSSYRLLDAECKVVFLQYKILSVTYKSLQYNKPSSISDLLTIQPTRSTRSSAVVTLQRPSNPSRLKISDRSFYFQAPALWNALPHHLRSHSHSSQSHSLLSLSSSQFHKQLKTHLFLHSYPP